ncbi:hypothetical protein M2284_004778 [Rhodococcus sp. LBL1]|nr:hypothetical protein [Rhodococcus sp. LBL1]MDH6686130.1 putative integral membrane protein [Rhodococcus sp. LBL2]
MLDGNSMDDGNTTEPLDESERAELLRLRHEVTALRTQVAETPGAPETVAHGPRHTMRWIAVTILLVLVAALSIVSVTSRFMRSQILDTDRYVTTVAPLGEDPAIQAEISDQITNEIFDRVDVEALTTEALTALTNASNLAENAPRVNQILGGLGPVLAGQAKSFIHDTVTTFVQSQQFEDLWIQANRSAHNALVSVVTGNYGPSSVQVDQSGTVSISLATIIDNVRTELTDRGFTFAEKIPTVDKQFVLFQSPDLVKAQRAVNALDKVSAVLPWLTIACAAAAVAVAPRGRRLQTLSLAGLSIAVGMLILAIGILVGRAIYLNEVPPDVLTPDAATAVIDTILVPMRTTLRAVAVFGLVIAVGAYLIGGSSSATFVRRGFGRGLDFARHPSPDRTPTTVERWAAQARVPLRCLIIGVAALLLGFWHYPTGLVVLWIVLIGLLALLALELLIRPVRASALPESGTPDDADTVTDHESESA